MESLGLVVVYAIVAVIIASKAKNKGFSWAKYFWVNLLLGFFGWVISIVLWQRDTQRVMGAPGLAPGAVAMATSGGQSKAIARGASAPPANSFVVPPEGYFSRDVVGESFYLGDIRSLALAQGGAGTHVLSAVLTPEPNNRHDRNAIAVMIEGKKVGHIAKDETTLFHPLLERLASQGLVLVCPAQLFYGAGYGDNLVGSVRLDLPHDLALVVPANDVPRGATAWPRGGKVQVSVPEDALPAVTALLGHSYQDNKVAFYGELHLSENDKGQAGVGVSAQGRTLGTLLPVAAKRYAPVLTKMGEGATLYAYGVATGNALAVDVHLKMKKPEELEQSEITGLGIL